jgi:porphobilinogen synthase
MRRLRRSESLRALVRETSVAPGDLIYPLFLCPGEGVRRAVGSMPGVFNLSVDEAVREAEEAASLGLGGLLLFGLPESKDPEGTGAWDDDGITQKGLRALKESAASKKLVLIADVCLCEYTSHGHCGMVVETTDGFEVDNDTSLDLLGRTATSLARAGADVVAPSDMMDGRVAAIRRALDDDSQLRLEVRFGILRPLSRGGRLRPPVWRPQDLPDGWRQPARGHARDRSRPGRRRGHDPDEARHALPGRGAGGA